MALISGVLIWSYEVGAKISASVYCQIFTVDDEHMENYPKMLYAKLPVICLIMLLVFFLPTNGAVKMLADKLRSEHIQKRDRVRAKLTKAAGESNQNEGGSQDYPDQEGSGPVAAQDGDQFRFTDFVEEDEHSGLLSRGPNSAKNRSRSF